jgi:hypothetical protein
MTRCSDDPVSMERSLYPQMDQFGIVAEAENGPPDSTGRSPNALIHTSLVFERKQPPPLSPVVHS